ncbi:hypothetical protein B0H13DRAFT_2307807 [Mycena leptocephala]|nr:hypothetical protein B0H13DRAFT_2307807 [Mycena leptocephala]
MIKWRWATVWRLRHPPAIAVSNPCSTPPLPRFDSFMTLPVLLLPRPPQGIWLKSCKLSFDTLPSPQLLAPLWRLCQAPQSPRSKRPQWKPRGYIARDKDDFTPEEIMTQVPALWEVIRSRLQLPENSPCPRVDNGSAWHSVVVHDVARATIRPSEEPLQCTSDLQAWLQRGGFKGRLKSATRLSRNEGVMSRKTMPIRLSLASKADAEFLVKNGALIYGSRCRVSHYDAKQRPRQRSQRGSSLASE